MRRIVSLSALFALSVFLALPVLGAAWTTSWVGSSPIKPGKSAYILIASGADNSAAGESITVLTSEATVCLKGAADTLAYAGAGTVLLYWQAEGTVGIAEPSLQQTLPDPDTGDTCVYDWHGGVLTPWVGTTFDDDGILEIRSNF